MLLKRLRELRKQYKFNQKFVAKELNISQAQYSKIELGICEISFDKLDKLAILYNTSIDYLLDRTDIQKPYPKRQKNLED